MSLPQPPSISKGQIALDPINGVVYYKDDNENLVATTWSWLRDNISSISTDDDVTISGNLTVSGTTVSVDVETVTIADNILVLNSNVTSTPTENAGIEVERGSSPNVSIRWNESTDKWEFTTDGSTYNEINGTATESLSWADPITVTLSGDLSGSVSFDGSENVTLSASVANDSHSHTASSLTFSLNDASDVSLNGSANGDFLRYNGTNWINDPVNLTTDTVGDYVAKLAAGTGITITNNSGEGATPNISFSGSIDNITDVVITSAQNGQILEYDGTAWVNTVRPSSEPIGHENKDDSVISFDEGSRQFSIAPASTSYTVWCTGKRYVKTSTETVTIPNTSGLYYIYFNSSGSLSYKTTFFTWDQDTPTAYIYWNSDAGSAFFFADERHGVTLDWATHEYLHRTRGAVIASGFGVNSYSIDGDGSSDDHAKFDIAGGTFFDEDLQVDIIHSNTPTVNTWEQVLEGNAEIPVFYKYNTYWEKDAATEFAFKQGSSRPQYNAQSGGNWTTLDIDNNKFAISWIIATNNLNEPVIAILGQDSYNTIGEAEAAVWEDLNLDGFPIFEFRPLHKVVFQGTDSFTNSVNTAIRGIYDLRRISATGDSVPTTPVSDHGSMTGLGDDDHTQYLNTTRHDTHDHSSVMSSVILDDISDVDASSPANDQVLAWSTSGSKWIAQTFTATVSTLDGVGDVAVPSPTAGEYLKWDGSAWVNSNEVRDNNIIYLMDVS